VCDLETSRICTPYIYDISTLRVKIYRTIILPVICMGVELVGAQRGECRLRVFEKRVQRRIFGPKRDEVTEEWRI
jgi:hypothetical protein